MGLMQASLPDEPAPRASSDRDAAPIDAPLRPSPALPGTDAAHGPIPSHRPQVTRMMPVPLSPRARLLVLLLLAGGLLTGCASGSRRYLAGLWGTPVGESRAGDAAADGDDGTQVAEKTGWFPWRSARPQADAEHVAAKDAATGTAREKSGAARISTAGKSGASADDATEGTTASRGNGTIFSAFVRKREPERDMTRDPFLSDYEQVEYRRPEADVAASTPFAPKSSASAGTAQVGDDADDAGPAQTGFASDFDSEMRRLNNALAREESPEGRLDWARDKPAQASANAGSAAAVRVSLETSGRAASFPHEPQIDRAPVAETATPAASVDDGDIGFRTPGELAAARDSVPSSAPTTPFVPVAPDPGKSATETRSEATRSFAAAPAAVQESDAPISSTETVPPVAPSLPVAGLEPQTSSVPADPFAAPSAPASQTAATSETAGSGPSTGDVGDSDMIVDTDSLLRRGSRAARPSVRTPLPAASAGPRPDANPGAGSFVVPGEAEHPLIIAPRPTAWKAVEANRPKTLQVSHDTAGTGREVLPLPTTTPVDVSSEPRAAAMQGADVSGAGLAPESLIERVRRQTEVALYVPDRPATTVAADAAAPSGTATTSPADRLPLSFRFSSEDATSAAPAPLTEAAATSASPQAATTDVAWEDAPLPVVEAPSHRGRNVLRIAFALALVGGIGWGLRRRLGRPAA